MQEPRIAVILAGDKFSSMGGVDKAPLLLADKRPVDLVACCLQVRSGGIMVAGRADYDFGKYMAHDADGPPFGRFTGVIATAQMHYLNMSA